MKPVVKKIVTVNFHSKVRSESTQNVLNNEFTPLQSSFLAKYCKSTNFKKNRKTAVFIADILKRYDLSGLIKGSMSV